LPFFFLLFFKVLKNDCYCYFFEYKAHPTPTIFNLFPHYFHQLGEPVGRYGEKFSPNKQQWLINSIFN
ncbi:MAG: hypothetical protein PHY53_04990, partial [Methanobacterium formicicum]|nr:hypothetical protein [Methanobacterium formicicum]